MPVYSASVRAKWARLLFTPVQELICSWNAGAPCGIDLRLLYAQDSYSGWLPYVRTVPWRSASPHDQWTRVEVDVIYAASPIVGLELRGELLERVFVATRPPVTVAPSIKAASRVYAHFALPVPRKSQYVGEHKGWCNPACVAMIMAYWAGRDGVFAWNQDVEIVAQAMYDHAYRGTGNWTFATAYASSFGLRAIVAYFEDLAHVAEFVRSEIPVALTVAWEEGELPGAPLPRSDGHLLVVRGFAANGDLLVNDPAQPEIAAAYPYEAFEALWQRAGSVGYVIAPTRYEELIMRMIGRLS